MSALAKFCPKMFARYGRHADKTPALGSIYVQIASLKIDATISVSLNSKMFMIWEISGTVGRDQPEIFASFTVLVFTARIVLDTLALRLVSMAIEV